MLDLAKIRAGENQSYIVMSSFIGPYIGMIFFGNAAILEPNIVITKGTRMVNQTKILQHIKEEGVIQEKLDIEYIKKIKKEYPMSEL